MCDGGTTRPQLTPRMVATAQHDSVICMLQQLNVRVCKVLQGGNVCCGSGDGAIRLWSFKLLKLNGGKDEVLQCVAVRCSALQCVALCHRGAVSKCSNLVASSK